MIGDLIFLIASGVVFLAIGAAAWRFLASAWPAGDELPGLALPLGLGLSGTLVGVAASLGSFESGVVLVAVLGGSSLGAVAVRYASCRREATLRFALKPSLAWAVPATALTLVVPGLFAPVIDGDALCYHLEVAKRTVTDGQVLFDSDLHETAYPLLVESLQAVALKFRGPVATRAVSFWFGIGLAYAAVVLARELVPGMSRYWAAIILLTSPIVHCGMIAPLNDVALASLCAAGLAAWTSTRRTCLSTERRMAIVGSFCGLACGVKFPGIVWGVVMTLFLVFESVTDRNDSKERRVRLVRFGLPLFLGVALLSGGFWYARAAVLTGNPVHPYFRNTFGGNGLDEVLEDARKSPVEHLLNIASAPLGLTFAPSRFDSFSHQIGPLFLALIPLGFLRKQPSGWRAYVVLGWLAMAICLTQRQSPRFYIAALAPWAAASSKSLADLWSFGNDSIRQNAYRSKIQVCSVALLLICMTAFDTARLRVGASVLFGRTSPEAWLLDNEPSARLATWVDSHLPENAKLIGQDHRAFYWPRRFTMEKAHRRRTGLLSHGPTPQAVVETLARSGFTHLVMAEPDPIDAVEFDTDLSVHLGPMLAEVTPQLDRTIPERDGYVRRYRIFGLNDLATSFAGTLAHDLSEARKDNAVTPAAHDRQP